MDKRKKYTICLDDDPVIHKIITQITGHPSLPFSCPDKMMSRADSYVPLSVFCDIHLGENISGLDYISRIRQTWQYTPIIVLTDNQSGSLVGKALALGANDFIRKPIVSEELIGRMQSRIGEMQAIRGSDLISHGDIDYNTTFKSVHCGEKTEHLGNLEARLLQTLISNKGLVIPKEVLRGKLWGDLRVSANSLDKKISTLRSALKEIGSETIVRSIYGGGVELVHTIDENKQKEIT